MMSNSLADRVRNWAENELAWRPGIVSEVRSWALERADEVEAQVRDAKFRERGLHEALRKETARAEAAEAREAALREGLRKTLDTLVDNGLHIRHAEEIALLSALSDDTEPAEPAKRADGRYVDCDGDCGDPPHGMYCCDGGWDTEREGS